MRISDIGDLKTISVSSWAMFFSLKKVCKSEFWFFQVLNSKYLYCIFPCLDNIVVGTQDFLDWENPILTYLKEPFIGLFIPDYEAIIIKEKPYYVEWLSYVVYGDSWFLLEEMLDCLILLCFKKPTCPSQEDLFRVFNWNKIIDVTYLFKPLGMNDL